MSTIKPHEYDADSWDDQDEQASFQRLHKQTGKPQTMKDARKQQSKEWGKAMNKFHKQREKFGKP